MNLNEFKNAIHENAVSHGWWDEDRLVAEALALIASELSEALEAARENQPPVWYDCKRIGIFCSDCGICDRSCGNHGDCEYRKPDGIAVELIDAAIRMLDFCGAIDVSIDETDESLIKHYETGIYVKGASEDIGSMIWIMHYVLTVCWTDFGKESFTDDVTTFLAIIFGTVKELGCDPGQLLTEKHEYNKHRPYKHGKKF